MEITLVLSNDTDVFQATLGQYIEANIAETRADRILAQEAADNAQSSAVSAATSAEASKVAADRATEGANSAIAIANDALSKAGSALETANGIDGKATQALNTASAADTAAAQANAKADNAVSTANAADSKAQNAVTTANGIDGKAQQALDTSNAANSKADQALAASDGTYNGHINVYQNGDEAGLTLYQGSRTTPGPRLWNIVAAPMSNNGDLYFGRQNDAGQYAGAPIIISRASGWVTTNSGFTSNGEAVFNARTNFFGNIDNTSTSARGVTIGRDGNNVGVRWRRTEGDTDAKVWDMVVDAGDNILKGRVVNDAVNAAADFMRVSRTAMAVSAIWFGTRPVWNVSKDDSRLATAWDSINFDPSAKKDRMGRTDGAAVPAGEIGEVLTFNSSPSGVPVGTDNVVVCGVTLPAGVWLCTLRSLLKDGSPCQVFLHAWSPPGYVGLDGFAGVERPKDGNWHTMISTLYVRTSVTTSSTVYWTLRGDVGSCSGQVDVVCVRIA
ncbi:hypothetical protein [Burkholderia cenocepacia]|uniref:hypothetical protein n=1 Tax=Burkholderia cenocepacia TaxID=95486 RepID=UPI002232383D|nr:hypothetical protein [Burkholderia cenocepacia]MCW3539347.1 hypothetical protein [Burkholderia cenocepacia]